MRSEIQKQVTLTAWFERQVDATPDAPAVTFEGAHLSYRDLNQRANQVAHLLVEMGVGPEVLVGLYMERGFELVIGLIGILKAGGGYLPIDPVYPKERIAFMLEDAQTTIILTPESLKPALPDPRAKVLCMDSERALFEGQSGANLAETSSPDNVAYVIFTSGSTGKPKGALVTHRNVTRLMQSTEHWYHFNATDVWTFFHSHAFDFSVWELWGALLYGGRVVMVPFYTSRSPDD